MSRRVSTAALVFAIAAFFCTALLHAQEPAASPHSQQTESHQAQEPSLNAEAGAGELAKASNEAAGEEEAGEYDQFKFSGAVQWLAHHTGMSVRRAYWVAMSLNFLAIALLIGLPLRSKLPSFFGARTESIQKGMTEARAASEDAKRRLADVETRLARLDADIAALRTASEKEAVAEEGRIRSNAEEDVRKVLSSAEQEIEATSRQARRELKSLAAELAVGLAANKLRIDAATDEALVRDFVQQLGKDGK